MLIFQNDIIINRLYMFLRHKFADQEDDQRQ